MPSPRKICDFAFRYPKKMVLIFIHAGFHAFSFSFDPSRVANVTVWFNMYFWRGSLVYSGSDSHTLRYCDTLTLQRAQIRWTFDNVSSHADMACDFANVASQSNIQNPILQSDFMSDFLRHKNIQQPQKWHYLRSFNICHCEAASDFDT